MEISFLFCLIPSRRLLNFPWIFEIVWSEISTVVPKFGVYYTKSSNGPLVSAILSEGVWPSDMLWRSTPAILSTILEEGPVRNHEEIKLLVNWSEFSRHKVAFLEFGSSDGPWDWRIAFPEFMSNLLPGGLASCKVELEIDTHPFHSTYTKPLPQYLNMLFENQPSPALAPLDMSSMGISTMIMSPNSSCYPKLSLKIRVSKPWHTTKTRPTFVDTECVFENDFDTFPMCITFANPSPLAYITFDNFPSVIYCMVHEIGVLTCTCPYISGMFHPLSIFKRSYLTLQTSVVP